MQEEKLREILQLYQDSCMEQLEKADIWESEHIYSRRFESKMKRLLWSRQHFGKDIRIGYAVRRIAIVAAVILSLLTANEVSAHVWGIDVWEMLRSMVDDGRGERVEFHKSDDAEEEEIPEIKHDEPEYVPEGYRLDYREEIGFDITIEWLNDEGKIIRYGRDEIIEGMAIVYDAEVDSKKRVNIHGLDAEIYYDDDLMGIIWYDAVYAHRIDSFIMGEEELLKMAESIYEE